MYNKEKEISEMIALCLVLMVMLGFGVLAMFDDRPKGATYIVPSSVQTLSIARTDVDSVFFDADWNIVQDRADGGVELLYAETNRQYVWVSVLIYRDGRFQHQEGWMSVYAIDIQTSSEAWTPLEDTTILSRLPILNG